MLTLFCSPNPPAEFLNTVECRTINTEIELENISIPNTLVPLCNDYNAQRGNKTTGYESKSNVHFEDEPIMNNAPNNNVGKKNQNNVAELTIDKKTNSKDKGKRGGITKLCGAQCDCCDKCVVF